MKKLIAITLAVVLVISLIAAIPAFAGQPHSQRALFEADIIDTNEDDTLAKGEVWIRADGAFKVEVEGVTSPDGLPKTYDVYLVYTKVPLTLSLGELTVDGDGEGALTGTISGPLSARGARVVIMNDGDVPPTHDPEFISGFELP